MSDWKPINFTYFDPANSVFKTNKNDKNRYTVYSCCNSENCDAYKRSKCLMLNGLWGQSCPYGKRYSEEGYTPRAKSYYSFLANAKEKYGDVSYKLKELNFVCTIGDYVFIPMYYLDNMENPFKKINKGLILKEQFNKSLIIELFNHVPLTFLGGVPIQAYKKDELPKFATQLKRYYPDLFAEVTQEFPEINNYVKDINYKDKYAYVKSLLPGKVKFSIYEVDWDGTNLTGKTRDFGIFDLEDAQVIIQPDDNTCVKIVDNNTVTEETRFRDE